MSIEPPSFSTTRWREGYRCDEVDAVVQRVMDGELSPEEVRALVFQPVRRDAGYDMGEVDDWLDQVYAARGGKPVEGPAMPPWPDAVQPGMPWAPEPDPRARARAELARAALVIAVVVGVAVWLYVSRF